MFERENLSGSNYNDWFRSPKMVLRVEKKVFVIKQPISLALHADSMYLRSGMQFLMLIMRLLVLRLEEGEKPVGPYVIKMKNYVAQLERLGYVLPRDLSVGLIMNGLTSNFASFGKARERIKVISLSLKTLNLLLKEHPTKDDICHHCKEAGHYKRNCAAYLAELIKKKKQVGTVKSAVRILNMVPTKKVEKTPYELWAGELEEIQNEDTSPFEMTSKIPMEVKGRFNFRRTSLTGFLAQSISSSNTIALDSPNLLVLNTGASQSRQHESRKPPTAELFDVDSRRISIRHYSISATLIFGTRRLERTATFSISTISE
uniref:CCHC-type domain-containing protein n=1 Tax=Tanacetum cinerariifolium TaxID=118510 RepID=A0A6L2KXP7_TANCI|nr:hypothetical protein [Tanacetum cinerariifolium]